MKILILAGGSGTRLWPVSRKNKPKQIQPFFDNKTLLQKTWQRLKNGFGKEDIFIITSEKQKDYIKEQLPDFLDENLILEPAAKSTAPAIGLAAIKILKQDANASMVTINSDHFIRDEEEYIKILKLAEKVVNKNPDHTVMVGVNPNYPDTGLGYIKMGSTVEKIDGKEIYQADKFVEKPDLETAKEYLKKWEYLWNPAIFVWKLGHLLNLFKKHLPNIYNALEKVNKVIGTEKEMEILADEFKKIEPISIDYGIMEKLTKMLVIPADFGWADIGNWRTIKDILSKNDNDDLVKGKYVNIDSSGNLVYGASGKLITAIGIKNMIIIETKDAVLICPKERAQEVKKIVKKIEDNKLDEYL